MHATITDIPIELQEGELETRGAIYGIALRAIADRPLLARLWPALVAAARFAAEAGEPLKAGGPSTPVEVIGFDELPVAAREKCRQRTVGQDHRRADAAERRMPAEVGQVEAEREGEARVIELGERRETRLARGADDRVHPAHARKAAARLKEYGYDYLYYENIDGGHAASANLNERAMRTALEFTYLSQRLMN